VDKPGWGWGVSGRRWGECGGVGYGWNEMWWGTEGRVCGVRGGGRVRAEVGGCRGGWMGEVWRVEVWICYAWAEVGGVEVMSDGLCVVGCGMSGIKRVGKRLEKQQQRACSGQSV